MGNLLTKIIIDIYAYTPWKKVFPILGKTIRLIIYLLLMVVTVSTSILFITMITGFVNVAIVGLLVGYDDTIGDEFQATIYRSTLVAVTVMWGKDIVMTYHREFFPLLSNI